MPLGPRFSNLVLQTIKTFLKYENKNKCFIISTCSNINILDELDLLSSFDSQLNIEGLVENDFRELKAVDKVFEHKELKQGISMREMLGMIE